VRGAKDLIAADHLIAHISSSPLSSRPLDGSNERPQALVAYMKSMTKTWRCGHRSGRRGAVPRVFLTLSEVIGHADLLVTKVECRNSTAATT
jgi:hypothetical protein